MSNRLLIQIEGPFADLFEAEVERHTVIEDLVSDFLHSLESEEEIPLSKIKIEIEVGQNEDKQYVTVNNKSSLENVISGDQGRIKISIIEPKEVPSSLDIIKSLSQRTIYVTYEDSGKFFEAELTPVVKVEQLVQDFIRSSGLPLVEGLHLKYVVKHKFKTSDGNEACKRLKFGQTLIEADVKSGDEVHIFSNPTDSGFFPVGAQEDNLIFLQNGWKKIKLIYIPVSGKGVQNHYWVFPELKIASFLDRLTKANSVIRITNQEFGHLALFSKNNHHLIPNDFTIEEAHIKDDHILLLSNENVIWELLPHARLIASLPDDVLLRGHKNTLNYIQNLNIAPSAINIEMDKKYIDECKLIFVGNGNVGKTSLIKRLIDNEFDPSEPKTGGIDIRDFYLDFDDRKIRFNIWDFGGQEIMHSIHSIFMTQRSIYVLVVNPRTDGQYGIEKELNYWLGLINNFAPKSPIIICVNKIETNPYYNIAKGTIKDHFPEIIDFVDTSCLLPKGINDLKATILKALVKIPYLKELIPENYLIIKDALRSLKEDYLDFHQFWEICKRVDPGFTINDAYTLAGFLHDLGIMLNFAESDYIQDTRVLNPSWITEGIYRLINSKNLQEKRGIINKEEAYKILHSEKFSHQREKDFILEKMIQFGFCYKKFTGQNRTILFSIFFPKGQARKI